MKVYLHMRETQLGYYGAMRTLVVGAYFDKKECAKAIKEKNDSSYRQSSHFMKSININEKNNDQEDKK